MWPYAIPDWGRTLGQFWGMWPCPINLGSRLGLLLLKERTHFWSVMVVWTELSGLYNSKTVLKDWTWSCSCSPWIDHDLKSGYILTSNNPVKFLEEIFHSIYRCIRCLQLKNNGRCLKQSYSKLVWKNSIFPYQEFRLGLRTCMNVTPYM